MYTYIYIHCYKNNNLESVKICIAPAGDDNLYCLNSKTNTLLITNKLPDANVDTTPKLAMLAQPT